MGKSFSKSVNDILINEVYSRYAKGGFLIGDVILLNKDFRSNPRYKALPEQVKKGFEDLLANPTFSDKYLRVVSIKSPIGSAGPVIAPQGQYESLNGAELEVAFEIAPGLLDTHRFVLPPDIFNLEPNFASGFKTPPVPDSLKYKNAGDGQARPAPDFTAKGSPATFADSDDFVKGGLATDNGMKKPSKKK